ncbi:NAD(P)-dependent oxidoreductase [Aquamicrobium sp. LC103]|uniref:NAD(P)-dependent oxidoreductase n=1 Tax=Aquamicrobium sp. LC103 TaxID=1120658 RepID=UPI0019821217|nr:NAD(P)-dependent oxidoreductase [Aquamicrobium sp. LC103]
MGTTLLRQASFDALYRSTNIGEIDGRTFDTVVCAGAPAQKWLANRDPEADREAIGRLVSRLRTISCRTFVLVSTVDVFKSPEGVDENTRIDEVGLHPYGLHRLQLETFVAEHFPRHMIVRLPGLVGPGLRKNILYDFHNDNNVAAIDSRHVFQFYPMVNLWRDIETALEAGLSLVHLTAEPLGVAEAALGGFGRAFSNRLDVSPLNYDMRTRHAALFGGTGDYQYSRRESLLAIRAYAQSESHAPRKDA